MFITRNEHRIYVLLYFTKLNYKKLAFSRRYVLIHWYIILNKSLHPNRLSAILKSIREQFRTIVFFFLSVCQGSPLVRESCLNRRTTWPSTSCHLERRPRSSHPTAFITSPNASLPSPISSLCSYETLHPVSQHTIIVLGFMMQF